MDLANCRALKISSASNSLIRILFKLHLLLCNVAYGGYVLI